jgi:coenzyme F420-reducing hydrogenase delta subunit
MYRKISIWIKRDGIHSYIRKSHGETNAECFLECLDYFSVRNNVVAVTCDNARNNDSFIEELVRSGVLVDGEHYRRCFAHVLNLAASDALENLESIIAELRTGITMIQSLDILLEQLENVCCHVTHEKYIKPVLEVATR